MDDSTAILHFKAFLNKYNLSENCTITALSHNKTTVTARVQLHDRKRPKTHKSMLLKYRTGRVIKTHKPTLLKYRTCPVMKYWENKRWYESRKSVGAIFATHVKGQRLIAESHRKMRRMHCAFWNSAFTTCRLKPMS